MVVFQEEMRHIWYILIDEMSFIGPMLFIKIDSHLREAFPESTDCPFHGRSIITMGNFAHLPLVRDKTLYIGRTT